MANVNIKDWKKIPNLISIFRIVFIPLTIYLFENISENRWFVILILVVFSLLDNLDGFAARKLNQITEFGKVIDPLIDKLFVITISVQLFLIDLIPRWFFFLVVARDLIIMFAGLLFIKKFKSVPPSDFIGKLTVGAIGCVFLFSLLDFQKLNMIYNLSLIITTFLINLSLINYGFKQFKRYK
jgi:CDP-diacylglycerol--glycerol-3-phosphate 3-phosphatidyltransferase